MSKVVIKWADAYGKDYDIRVSDDAVNWRTIFSRRGWSGGIDTIAGLNGAGRYVEFRGIRRAFPQWWGYSFWEMEVYGAKLN